jgi:ParB family transcriptional regulator, chromosome partitioning protein
MEQFKEIPIETLSESPLNPRRPYDQKKIEEMAQSMGNGVGVIEPLVVRLIAAGTSRGREHEIDHYEIVAGSRRYRAAKLAALGTVPAVVRELTDQQTLEIMVIENNQRDDTNALEEAEGYERLLKTSYTLERLADKIGKSHKYIYDRLKLLQLIPEAKTILLTDRMTAGHAILLARLKPDEQKRAIDVDAGGLFQEEHTLFDEDPDIGAANLPKAEQKFHGYKARSVRELEGWIDEHVRFDRNAPIVQDLFPETAAAVTDAKEMKLKVIQITHDHYVQPDAKEGNTERIYTERSWKLADGSSKEAKTCDKWVTGVIVIGPERGRAMKVCVHKECPVHWAKEKKAKASTSQEALRKRQEAESARQQSEWKREEQKREQWRKALPAIIEACAEKIKTATTAMMAEIIRRLDQRSLKQAGALLPKPKTAEGLCRLVALTILVEEASQIWQAPREFPPRAKRLGVDVAAILKPETSADVSKSNGKEEASMATKSKKTKAKKKKPASKKKDAAQQTA